MAVVELVGRGFLSFFIASRGPAYFWTSVLRRCYGPVCKPRVRRGIGRFAMCAISGEGGAT